MESAKEIDQAMSEIKRRDKRVRTVTYLLTFIPVVAAIIFLVVVKQKISERSKELSGLELRIKQMKDSIRSIQRDEHLQELGYTKEKIKAITDDQFNEIGKLNNQIASLKSKVDTTIGIRYYPKLTNEGKAIDSLQYLGFKLTFLNSINELQNIPTNSIWIGANALKKFENVQLVAMYLLRAGVGLKSIRLFGEKTAKIKANFIEIGSDNSLAGKPDLMVDDIMNAKSADGNGLIH